MNGPVQKRCECRRCAGRVDIISRLPNDVACYILTILTMLSPAHLTTAARVCKRWRELVSTDLLWKNYLANIDLDTITSDEISMMQTRKIRHVSVFKCSNTARLKHLTSELTFLETLDISRILIPSFELENIATKDLTQLRSFRFCSLDLNTGILKALFKLMSRLQHLTVEGTKIHNEDTHAFFELKHLTTLKAQFHVPLKLDPMANWTWHPTPDLRELSLGNVEIEDRGLDLLRQAFPQLKTLQVELSPDVTMNGLINLKHLQQLTTLKLKSSVFKDEWLNLFRDVPRLSCLHLQSDSNITTRSLEQLSGMPHLEELALSPFKPRAEEWGFSTQDFAGLKRFHFALAFRDINLMSTFLTLLPNLEELSFMQCDIKDAFWENSYQEFTNLKSLILGYCNQLSDASLTFIAQIPGLEKLELSGCHFTDNGMQNLGRRESSLLSLTLCELRRVTDAGLCCLLKGLHNLKRLRVFHRNTVAGQKFVSSIEKHPTLETLQMKVSIGTRKALKWRRPLLRVNNPYLQPDDPFT